MNKPAISQAKMLRMKRAIERDGSSFRGFKMHPDGSVEALVGEPDLTPPANGNLPSDPLDAELAEWAAKRGYN
jgi:hypothetical protein